MGISRRSDPAYARRTAGRAVACDKARIRFEVQMSDKVASALLPSFERLLHEAPAIIYVYDLIEARSLYQNRELGDLLGYADAHLQANDWRALMHPDDADRFPAHRERLRRLKLGESELFEYRLRDVSGEWRWMMSRDVPLSLGANDQVIQVLGTATDATERRRSEERQQLLARELNHRVKNFLSIVHSIIVRTHRSQPAEQFLPAVTARLQALAGAADLLTEEAWSGVPAGDVVERLLDSLPHLSGRVTVDGPHCVLPSGGSITLSLVLHELATNAMKHGALSTAGGEATLSWTCSAEHARFEWVERGGPPVTEPSRRGFGSQLIQRSLADSDGEFELRFDPAGVCCTFQLPVVTA